MHGIGLIIPIATLMAVAALVVAEPVPIQSPFAATAQPPPAQTFPAHWFVGNEEQRARYEAMVNKPAPLLAPLTDWHNGEVRAEDIQGRIVVVAFWATWSPPSLQSIAALNVVQQRFGRHGVTVLGVCGSGRDDDQMAAKAAEHNMLYATARAPWPDASEHWTVTFWPTLFVVDRLGVVRAAGVNPQFIGEVVAAVLSEQPLHAGESAETDGAGISDSLGMPPVPELWREGNPERRQMLLEMELKSPPPLTLHKWIGPEAALEQLRGQVVLLHFWRTTPGTGLRGMTLSRNIADRYRDEGLTVIGIYAGDDPRRMAAAVERFGITYPVAADVDGATVRAYRVDGYPDYYLIDRKGQLRVADCGDRWVDNAVRWLLRGGPDAPAPQAKPDSQPQPTRRQRVPSVFD